MMEWFSEPMKAIAHELHNVFQSLNLILIRSCQMVKEIEDLKTQVVASLAVESAAVAKLKAAEAHAADLQAQLDAAKAAAVTDADKADLVKVASDLKVSADALAAA